MVVTEIFNLPSKWWNDGEIYE